MKRDNRLSGVLHVLLHMAEDQRPCTSEVLARALQTNPVVIRRMLAGLRKQGIVRSEKGHGGGWTLSRDLHAITLRDIYNALGCPPLFAIGNRNENPNCLVEQSVNTALDGAFREAEEILLSSFDALTLAALREDFQRRFRRLPRAKRIKDAHA